MLVGLSPALGAFLAGVGSGPAANSDTSLKTDLNPSRGCCMGCFFIPTVCAGINFVFLPISADTYHSSLGMARCSVRMSGRERLYPCTAWAPLYFKTTPAGDRWLFALGSGTGGVSSGLFCVKAASRWPQGLFQMMLAETLLLVLALLHCCITATFRFILYEPDQQNECDKNPGRSLPTKSDEQGNSDHRRVSDGFGQIVNRARAGQPDFAHIRYLEH